MGGCCCCFSFRRSEPVRAPTYYYCPRTSEERLPLSAHHDGPSGSSAGLLVDTNLDTSNPDTSNPDTYTAPPLPIPFDVDLGHPQSPRSPFSEINYGKTETAAGRDAGSVEELNAVDCLENPTKDQKKIYPKEQSILELTLSKEFEDDLKKPGESIAMTIEEEDCPICLEEYTEENPKMLTKCEHHYHLCCILEWMERSDSCPVCHQEVVIDENVGS